jgi:hypothetical protein
MLIKLFLFDIVRLGIIRIRRYNMERQALVECVWKDDHYIKLIEGIETRFKELCLMYPEDKTFVNKATDDRTATINDVEVIVGIAVDIIMKNL